MKIDPKHSWVKAIWKTFIIVDVLLMLLLAAMAVAKPLMMADTPRAMTFDPGYTERASERVPDSPLKTLVFKFDLCKENNVAVWFSSLHFTCAGLLALLVFFSLPQRKNIVAVGWLLFGLATLYISLDETATLHEDIGEHFSISLPDGVVFYDWVPLYALPLAVAVVLSLLWMRRALAGNGRLRRLAYAGLACWVGVFLFEASAHYWPEALSRVEIFFEEGLELAGALLFIYAFAHYQATLPDRAVEEKTAQEA